jgi:hypothetical protein
LTAFIEVVAPANRKTRQRKPAGFDLVGDQIKMLALRGHFTDSLEKDSPLARRGPTDKNRKLITYCVRSSAPLG